MNWISNPAFWVSLVTLTILEIVLGIDNIVFLTILSGKLSKDEQPKAQKLGLILAVIPRVLLLLTIGLVMKLTKPIFTLPFGLEEGEPNLGITGQDLVFIAGGLFLIYKSVKEIHHKLEGMDEEGNIKVLPTMKAVLIQIMLVNIVFSLDSVITAIGMVDQKRLGGTSIAIGVMIAAVVLSTIVMLAFAGKLGKFVDRHPTVKMLAMSFLILIGVNLLGEGFHQHIPKGYTYFSMAFAIAVEMLNLKIRAQNAAEPVRLRN